MQEQSPIKASTQPPKKKSIKIVAKNTVSKKIKVFAVSPDSPTKDDVMVKGPDAGSIVVVIVPGDEEDSKDQATLVALV